LTSGSLFGREFPMRPVEPLRRPCPHYISASAASSPVVLAPTTANRPRQAEWSSCARGQRLHDAAPRGPYQRSSVHRPTACSQKNNGADQQPARAMTNLVATVSCHPRNTTWPHQVSARTTSSR